MAALHARASRRARSPTRWTSAFRPTRPTTTPRPTACGARCAVALTFRRGYRDWRAGAAAGASGEVAARAAASSPIDRRRLDHRTRSSAPTASRAPLALRAANLDALARRSAARCACRRRDREGGRGGRRRRRRGRGRRRPHAPHRARRRRRLPPQPPGVRDARAARARRRRGERGDAAQTRRGASSASG